MINEFLSGEKLYGDDFKYEEIVKWYKEEEEAYSALIKEYKRYVYNYHEINKILGYSYLPKEIIFKTAMSFGGAYGDEIIPIKDKIEKLIIVEASDVLRSKEIEGIIPNYIKPSITGVLSVENESVDLITCFGVLHHIPNVSFILNEFNRMLSVDGYLLLKEPIISMGDWTNKRAGLTKNERGIPKEYFDKAIINAGFKIVKRTYCTNPITRKLGNIFNVGFNSKALVWFDLLLSRITQFNYKYHPRNFIEKIQPQAVYYVLQKK